uniref:BLTX737 n=1 Tax=Nephila pilipes TaxID=299642 RepID=A0A076L0V9_NEPPI|nr:BLTX737 [Nephila pilipes]
MGVLINFNYKYITKYNRFRYLSSYPKVARQ